MLLLNIILILLWLGFVGTGLKDGFIHTLGRLVGSIAGFVIARSWSITVGSFLAVFLPTGWARFIAFLIIFIVITRLVGFLFTLADGAFKILSFIPFLKTINNFLGALLGIVEGVIMLGGSIWLIIQFNLFPVLVGWLQQSFVAGLIEKIFNFLLKVVL